MEDDHTQLPMKRYNASLNSGVCTDEASNRRARWAGKAQVMWLKLSSMQAIGPLEPAACGSAQTLLFIRPSQKTGFFMSTQNNVDAACAGADVTYIPVTCVGVCTHKGAEAGFLPASAMQCSCPCLRRNNTSACIVPSAPLCSVMGCLTVCWSPF